MNIFKSRFKKRVIAVAITASIGLATPLLMAADNTSSAIIGTVIASSYADQTVTATNSETGYSRTIGVDSSGSFRFTKLPSGKYTISISKGDTVIAEDTFVVSLGGNTSAVFDLTPSDDGNTVTVFGSRVSSIDITTMDSGLVLGEEELDAMPIPRNIQSVALLAPGTVGGDTKFSPSGGAFTSFGGSSISENSCYINGLEVTNTRQGLGCGTVPFEFYKEFQVKTGGYSAMYGRATGGVINSTTKSGTNVWEFSAIATFEPDSLRESGQVSRAKGGTGNIFRDERNYSDTTNEFTFTAGGPIIEDTLFIYALVNPRDSQREYGNFTSYDESSGITEFRKRTSDGSDNFFWGTKIDWDINDNHRLSYFAYSNQNTGIEDIYAANPSTGAVGGLIDQSVRDRGGEAESLTYTGHFTDDLSVNIMVGSIDTEYSTNIANTECPSVNDNRTNPAVQALPCGSGGRLGSNFDSNDQTRLDVEWILGDHAITAGYDYQKRTSTNRIDRMAGDHAWSFDTLGVSADLGGDGIDFTNETGADLDYVSDRIFIGGGEFYSDLSAYYVEDQWQMTENLLITAGLRVDEFESFAVGGNTLLKFKTDVAPRIGFSWDVNGDGESKLYGTWGHFYLPVANNTIYRVGSGISDSSAYYTFTGIDAATGSPTGTSPITGDITSSTYVNSQSIAPDQAVFQAEEADPFSKEEFILGYETHLSDDFTLSVRGTYRTILTALDDFCGKWAYPYCVMLNPGEASTWYKDGMYWGGQSWEALNWADLDGVADPGSRRTHTVAEIGLPKAKNDYTALQTTLDYNSEDFRWKMIYTISKSEGNFEGGVKSDIGQADAGLTQDWDFAALMDGADGYQPNDRRHVFKFFGSYDVTEDLSVGFNSVLSSGRPMNIFGQGHPSNDPNLFGGWGDFYYVYQGCSIDDSSSACPNDNKQYSYHPRGSAGRTPWTFQLDLSANYTFVLGGMDMLATVNVYNVLNAQSATSFNEHYESSEGSTNQWYGAAYSWQTPRYVSLSLQARF